MAITAINPSTGGELESGDSVAFTIDDTYTSLVIKVQTASALAVAYSTALGGGQAGYSVSVADNGDGTHTVTFTADAGWDVHPQLIYVVEDETGSEATTNLSYSLVGEAAYKEGTYPYNQTAGDPSYMPIAWLPLSGSGAPGVSTANGKSLGHVYIDVDSDTHYALVDATVDGNVWDSGGGGGSGDVTAAATLTEDKLVTGDTASKAVKTTTVTAAEVIANTAKVSYTDAAAVSANTAKISYTDAAAVSANTAKTTNATHTGDVTGSGALTIGALKVLEGMIAADAVTLAKMASGTAGELITYDASGDPIAVAVGTATYVLTSNGVGVPPTFQVAAAGGGDVTAGATLTEDTLVAGDAAAKGVKTTTVTAAEVTANTAKVTNATHTGDVTGATALTIGALKVLEGMIAADAVTLAKMDGGTAGELISYDASGDPIAVAVGTATYVLTSNGVGLAPTFQLATGGTGGDISLGLRTLGNTTIGVTSGGDFDTNNATPAGVTSIRINILNDMQNIFDATATTGTLLFRDRAAPTTNWVIYNVTALVDTPSYAKTFTVAWVAEAGTVWGTANWGIQYIADGGGSGVTADGTTAQDAVFLAERADHVNTPATGFSELWLNSAINPPRLQMTNEAGADGTVIVHRSAPPGNNAILTGYGSEGTVDSTTNFTYNASNGQLASNQIAGSSILFKENATIGAAPAAGQGSYWVRDDAPTVPMFTDDDAVAHNLLGRSATIHYGGVVKADGTTSTWYGHPPTTVWYHTTITSTRGTGTDATFPVNDVGWLAPYAGVIEDVELWIRVADANVAGDWSLVKTTFADGASTATGARLGSLINFAGGGASTNSYDLSTTFTSSNAVAKGDTVNWGYRNSDATGGATCYFRLTATFRETF